MKYNVGDTLITKKPHVCGSNQWEVMRIGAEIKLKCLRCGREIMMLKLELDRRVKIEQSKHA